MATFNELQQMLAKLSKVNGVTMVDVMALPAPLDSVLKKLLKEIQNLDQIADELQLPIDQTRQLLDSLIEKGFLTAEEQMSGGGRLYKVYFARMRKHNISDKLFSDE
jgi:predicted ArsR family transcriptional regulator